MKFHIILCTTVFFSTGLIAQHPHILVKSSEKQAVLDKIKQQSWAKSIFDDMQKEISPYVNRHQTDPQWILSPKRD